MTTFWQAIADLPHRLEYVVADGWRTRVLTVGDGEQTVLLLNGTTGHIEAWTHNIRAFVTAGYRVIGYDYPGHGYTTLATHDLEIAHYEAHLLALMDALELDQAHLAGESLGGWVLVKFAQHHPERVRSLILSAPGGRMLPEERVERAQSVNAAALESPTFDTVKKRLQIVIHDPALITDELVEVRRAIYSQPGFAASAGHISVLREPETRYRNRVDEDDYARITAPTLLVWTDHEPTGGVDVGEQLAAALTNGELLTIRGAAHWPQWEDPEAFNERALDFLGKNS